MDQTPVRRPGEMALVAIKTQSKAVQVFKRPVVPVIKKEKKIILNEDSYMKVNTFRIVYDKMLSFSYLFVGIRQDHPTRLLS